MYFCRNVARPPFSCMPAHMSTLHLAPETLLRLKGSSGHFIIFSSFFSHFPSRESSQAGIMGRGVSPCPVAAVIRTDRTGVLGFFSNIESGWKSLRFFRGGRLQKGNEKSEMSLPLFICPVAPLCVLLLSPWHFVSAGIGPAVKVNGSRRIKDIFKGHYRMKARWAFFISAFWM